MVLYFPISLPIPSGSKRSNVLHLVWPHRWEHDKNPEDLLKVLHRLSDGGYEFQISVLGEQFSRVDLDFLSARESLQEHVLHWGRASKNEYLSILQTSHIVLSTAKHEFFGVAMLEATMSGCLPLCPNRLVYPEIYPSVCLFSDLNDLLVKLTQFSLSPDLAIKLREKFNGFFEKFQDSSLLPNYLELFK